MFTRLDGDEMFTRVDGDETFDRDELEDALYCFAEENAIDPSHDAESTQAHHSV